MSARDTSESRRVALVVSGGGAKGAFAAGVVRHIFDTYRASGWFSIVGGCSTGAMIAPLVGLMGGPPEIAREAMDTMIEQYSTVSTADILEKQSIIGLVRRRDCLNRSAPLRARIGEVFRPEHFEWLRRREMPHCYVVYTNYCDGRLVTVSPRDPDMTRERFIDAIVASASVPVIMEPVMIDGQACYDGGVRDVLPISPAIDLGAETIVPVVLDDGTAGRLDGRSRQLDEVLYRTLAIMVDETERSDLETAHLVSVAVRAKREVLQLLSNSPDLLEKAQAVFDRSEYGDLFGRRKRLTEIVQGLRPDTSLADDVLSLDFDPSAMRRWMDLGERKARAVLRESPFGAATPGISVLDPRAGVRT